MKNRWKLYIPFYGLWLGYQYKKEGRYPFLYYGDHENYEIYHYIIILLTFFWLIS